jgi:low temperature requirement protein LtrA
VHDAARALAPSAILLPSLLIAAAFLDGAAQAALWLVVLLVDYGTGGVRGIAGWQLSPGHFAERHGLIIIIALGESIVAVGVGLGGADLGAGEIVAASLGVVVAAGLWWTYFDGVSVAAERAVHDAPAGRARNTLARDSYSYLHLFMAAGIVLVALGIKKSLGAVDESLKLVPAFALCGGVSCYLLAQVALQRRSARTVDLHRLVAAAAGLGLVPLAVEASALLALTVLALLCVGLVAYEATRVPQRSH